MIKAIIFDLDGTLLNSVSDIKSALNYMLRINNIKNKLSKKLLLKLLGNGSYNLVKNVVEHFKCDFKDKYLNDYLNYYKDYSLVKTKPYKGVIKLLNVLNNKNIKLAVCSNKNNNDVVKICDRFFKDNILFKTGTIDNMPIKPDKYLPNLCIEKLNANIDDTLYIGDTEVDFLTAKNSNLDFICCLWGFRSYKFLKDYDIKNYAKKPSDIIRIIKKINDN